MDENRYKQRKPAVQKVAKVQYGSLDGFVTRRTSSAKKPVQSLQPKAKAALFSTAERIVHSQAAASRAASKPVPEPQAVEAPQRVHPLPLEQMLKASGEKQKRFRFSKRKLLLRSALVMVLISVSVGGFIGIRGLHTVDKVFHGNVISDVTAAFHSTPLKGESDGRVNILLAGDSSDDPGHAGADLTDSILVLSIDTQNHSAFLLSIPRDLWVNIPGLDSYQKINAANSVTKFDTAGYPTGGMGQLEQVVETELGIPIDYYGLMDYGAFQDAVNAVGGVTITVNSSDPRGLYDPGLLKALPNGPVTLDGATALDLARARGDQYGSYGFPNSDFDRTQHQRQLFIAVAEKAKTLGVISNPVKISDLFNALSNNFQTDLSLQNVLRLVQITKGVNLNNIQSYSFSSTLTGATNPILKGYTDPASGEDALIATDGVGDYGQLQQYYDQLTSSNPVVKESPNVVVLNASDVTGLATKEKAKLQNEGFNVATVADANNEYPGTLIIDNSTGTKPNSLKLLQQLYPGTTVTNDTSSAEAEEAQGYTSDFVVILGQNWDSSASSTTSN